MAETKDQQSPRSSTISLDDYSTFQYMLAFPGVAKPIINQVSSFVFYDEPYDKRKNESDHKIMAQGPVTLLGYYVCCLVVLPSHILGMSEWILSSSSSSSSSANYAAEEVAAKAKNDQGQKILRRFCYSYYYGLLRVETHHVATAEDDNDKEGNNKSFRIVEYLDVSIWAWILMDIFYVLVIAGFVAFFQVVFGYFHQNSLLSVVAWIFIPLKCAEQLYRLSFRV